VPARVQPPAKVPAGGVSSRYPNYLPVRPSAAQQWRALAETHKLETVVADVDAEHRDVWLITL
jgi:hypothetical protein